MKNLCVVLVLLVGGLFCGCSGLGGEYAERQRRVREITDIQMRELVDDVDFIFLMDRNSELTKYHPRVGS